MIDMLSMFLLSMLFNEQLPWHFAISHDQLHSINVSCDAYYDEKTKD
jgi:hypothetical protein